MFLQLYQKHKFHIKMKSLGSLFILTLLNHMCSRWGVPEEMKMRSGLESGPLILFNKTGHTNLITSYEEFLGGTVNYDIKNRKLASWGVPDSIIDIPVGYKYSVIVVVGESVTGVSKVLLE